MTEYTPDAWRILKIDHKGDVHYRVFAGWYGGYLNGDSWKLNSGIVEVRVAGDLLEFVGASGSVYRCHRDCERMSGYMNSIYQSFISENNEDRCISLIDYKDMNLKGNE